LDEEKALLGKGQETRQGNRSTRFLQTMKQLVKLNWKVADLIREEQSFANWYWNVFKLAPSPKDLKDIKKRERELAQMKQAVLDAGQETTLEGDE
jgi:hypothetical protein